MCNQPEQVAGLLSSVSVNPPVIMGHSTTVREMHDIYVVNHTIIEYKIGSNNTKGARQRLPKISLSQYSIEYRYGNSAPPKQGNWNLSHMFLQQLSHTVLEMAMANLPISPNQ